MNELSISNNFMSLSTHMHADFDQSLVPTIMQMQKEPELLHRQSLRKQYYWSPLEITLFD